MSPGLDAKSSAVGEREHVTEAIDELSSVSDARVTKKKVRFSGPSASADKRTDDGACTAHAGNTRDSAPEDTSGPKGPPRAARSEQEGAEEQPGSGCAAGGEAGPTKMLALPSASRSSRELGERGSRSGCMPGDIRKLLASLVENCAKDVDHLQTLRGIVEQDQCEYNALTSHLQTFQRMLAAAQERMKEPVANISNMLREVEGSKVGVDSKSEGSGLRRELRLMQEMGEVRQTLTLYREEMAGEGARFASKTARLQNSLKRSEGSTTEAEEKLLIARHQLTEHSGHHSHQARQLNSESGASCTAPDLKKEECEALRQRLAQQQAQQMEAVDALRARLCGAIESKRIADARLDEFKHEMKDAEARYKEEVKRLEQAIAQSQVAPQEFVPEASSEGIATNTTADELRNHLRAATEERNLLQHTLEWKAVDFESKIEEMDRQCKATNMQTQKDYESKIQGMKQDHRNELDHLQKKLELVKAAASAGGDLGELRTKVAQPQPRGLFFPCPVRRHVPEPAATADPGIPGPCGFHFCQEICWRVVSSISDTISLLCRPQGLVIQQASRAASTFWTSDMLIGRSVLNLLGDATRAPWLRKAISTNQSLLEQSADTSANIPGFAMHQIGNEVFKTQDSQSVRFRIICVHLLQDPSLRNRTVAVLIILEPAQREQDARWATSRLGGRKKAPSVHLRSSRSVASEDIKPGDSVSNMGMY